MISYRYVKRALDVVGSAGALVLLSPIMAGTAVLVRKNFGSPVLFKQERPGLNGKIFKLYKFRSMKEVNYDAGLVTDQQRLTEFGMKLRSTSLDELPSLLNVLKGEMSFVGPRPLLVSYLERYSPEQARRHEVRPGITGLAQVRGRNNLDWKARFATDIKYVDSQSWRLDTQILLATVVTVLRRSGVSAEGESTMTEFTGSDSSVPGHDNARPSEANGLSQ